MWKKFLLGIGLLAICTAVVTGCNIFFKNTSTQLANRVQQCLVYTEQKSETEFLREFEQVCQGYANRRLLLAVFMNNKTLDNIDLLIRKIELVYQSTGDLELASESLSELKYQIERLWEDSRLNLKNIL